VNVLVGLRIRIGTGPQPFSLKGIIVIRDFEGLFDV